MAIGAVNELDKKLALMYADKQTYSLDLTSKVDPENVWKGMAMLAVNNRAMINNTKVSKI